MSDRQRRKRRPQSAGRRIVRGTHSKHIQQNSSSPRRPTVRESWGESDAIVQQNERTDSHAIHTRHDFTFARMGALPPSRKTEVPTDKDGEDSLFSSSAGDPAILGHRRQSEPQNQLGKELLGYMHINDIDDDSDEFNWDLPSDTYDGKDEDGGTSQPGPVMRGLDRIEEKVQENANPHNGVRSGRKKDAKKSARGAPRFKTCGDICKDLLSQNKFNDSRTQDLRQRRRYLFASVVFQVIHSTTLPPCIHAPSPYCQYHRHTHYHIHRHTYTYAYTYTLSPQNALPRTHPSIAENPMHTRTRSEMVAGSLHSNATVATQGVYAQTYRHPSIHPYMHAYRTHGHTRARTHTHTHRESQTDKHTCIHTYIHTYRHTGHTDTRTHTHTHTHTHGDRQTHIHTCIQTNTHTHTHTHRQTDIGTQIHTHTETHTQQQQQQQQQQLQLSFTYRSFTIPSGWRSRKHCLRARVAVLRSKEKVPAVNEKYTASHGHCDPVSVASKGADGSLSVAQKDSVAGADRAASNRARCAWVGQWGYPESGPSLCSPFFPLTAHHTSPHVPSPHLTAPHPFPSPPLSPYVFLS